MNIETFSRKIVIIKTKSPFQKKMEGAFALRSGPDPPTCWGQAILELVPKNLGDDRQMLQNRLHKKAPSKKNGRGLLRFVAVRTRLELATSCVTGRHSNQLNYHRTS